MRRAILYTACCLLLAACGNDPGPQRAANREGKTAKDSALLAMMEVNQRLAEEADREILQQVQADTLHRYAQCEQGAWVARVTQLPESEQPKMGEPVAVSMRIRTLDGELLQDIEGEYVLGRGEMPLGIEYAIRELRRGEEGIILAPWHAAFGVDGTDNIVPYSNVRIEITIQ